MQRKSLNTLQSPFLVAASSYWGDALFLDYWLLLTTYWHLYTLYQNDLFFTPEKFLWAFALLF